jgi:hypothetical protein
LRRLFRGSVASLVIDWSDAVSSSIVRIFGSSLCHLSLSYHSQASQFLRDCAASQTRLQSLLLSNCAVDHLALRSLILQAQETLKALTLSFREGPPARFSLDALPTC